ncbi:MAG: methyltransferase domain-containing protein [Myxococcota bacterium]
MSASNRQVLHTTAGDVPLEEVRLDLAGRGWSVLHAGAVLTREDEQRVVDATDTALPYGIALWPSALALAHELAQRPVKDLRVLELGAGTGLPGLVAAAGGARVFQTDRQSVALHLCRKNAERNGVVDITHRPDDWAAWTDRGHYDLILGSDILYSPTMHPFLRRIFDANLAPGGRLLLADPLRPSSLALLEEMEGAGWWVSMSQWTVGLSDPPRPVGVFELGRR